MVANFLFWLMLMLSSCQPVKVIAPNPVPPPPQEEKVEKRQEPAPAPLTQTDLEQKLLYTQRYLEGVQQGIKPRHP